MTDEELTAIEDFALSLAEDDPGWQNEQATVQIRVANHQYYLVDGVSAGSLESLRKLIPIIIEERRKRQSEVVS